LKRDPFHVAHREKGGHDVFSEKAFLRILSEEEAENTSKRRTARSRTQGKRAQPISAAGGERELEIAASSCRRRERTGCRESQSGDLCVGEGGKGESVSQWRNGDCDL